MVEWIATQCPAAPSTSEQSYILLMQESMYYEEQNIYLNGILKRREAKKTRGHPRKACPTVSAKGKRVGRPPAEDSCFTYEYYIRNEKGVDARVCQKAFCSVHGFGPKRLLILRKKTR